MASSLHILSVTVAQSLPHLGLVEPGHLVDRPVSKATIRNAAFESALTPWRARLKVALLTERRPSGRGGQPIGTLKLRRARVSRLRRH